MDESGESLQRRMRLLALLSLNFPQAMLYTPLSSVVIEILLTVHVQASMSSLYDRSTVTRTTVRHQPGLHSRITPAATYVRGPPFTPRYNGWPVTSSTYWYDKQFESELFGRNGDREFQWDPNTARGWVRYGLHQWRQLPPLQQNCLVGLTSFVCGYMLAKRIYHRRRNDLRAIHQEDRANGIRDEEDNQGIEEDNQMDEEDNQGDEEDIQGDEEDNLGEEEDNLGEWG